MCDAYFPAGALDAEAEHQLIRNVTELLVDHEMRRIAELMDDPDEVQSGRRRALLTAWTFLHRVETFVGGDLMEAPFYKFVASIPEGNIDDLFRDAVVPAITAAVADAEGGQWPHPKRRVWVFTRDIPDGTWGASGRTVHLGTIVDFVTPGWGGEAEQRLAAMRRESAAATLALVQAGQPTP
ncbi:hypothetical protein [Mycobacterium sp.]|uniref:hypothetical protein n=1 Tax=Mycobacterium sp. TaxID=1785 RepID=UPI003D0D6C48